MSLGVALKICVISGTRADYGPLYPLLKRIDNLDLIVTGMHWYQEYGETGVQVMLDFPTAWKMWVPKFEQAPLQLSQYFESYCHHFVAPRPDWLVVTGDRPEMLAGAITAAYMNIPVAHIQGGDRTGTIDDPSRHAITRFAHLHYPCTRESAERLIRMGEESWRIHIIGHLGIYAMPNFKYSSKADICSKLGLDHTKEIVLLVQHPVSNQASISKQQMLETIYAAKGYQTIAIYPNSDPGSDGIISALNESRMRAIPSLPYTEFINLLKNSDVIVGNSSCALHEAPVFGIPAVNIGGRQDNREHGDNVVNVDYNREDIRLAIGSFIGQRKCSNPFKSEVDGINIILDTLNNTPRNEHLLQKRIVY